MTSKLAGKVALVTGGSAGIGLGIAKHLAQEGARVFITGRRQSELDKAIAAIGGSAAAMRGDTSNLADLDHTYATIKAQAGHIDVLAVNAGVYEFLPIEEISEQHFHRHFDTNVLGMLLVTQEALKHFNASGGSIINISSLASSLTPPTAVVYNATKAAVDAITRTLAKELGPRKIRVNSVNPGMVITDGVISGGFHESDFRKMLESQTPLGRVGQTDDIAPAVVFFASDDSKWITGETLLIAGGLR